MNAIETSIVKYLQQRLAAGALTVSGTEIMSAIVPSEHPEYRFKPQYKFALERLQVRHVLNALADTNGMRHYFIGNAPTPAMYAAHGKAISSTQVND